MSHAPGFTVLAVVALLASLLCSGCSNSEYGGWVNESELDLNPASDMLRVKASGQAVLMGSNDTLSPMRDKPQMWVTFSYDFSMGKHEVTLGEMDSVLRASPGPKGWKIHGPVPSDSFNYPVTNVTYYDAVLFANARSKSEGMDTAYSYHALSFDADGNCSDVEGLVFHPEVNAYRLPTEAEWMYFAVRGWQPSVSWNNSNSSYRTHEVCSAKDSLGNTAKELAESLVPCDMAGNVAEWTNDWLVTFLEGEVTNYAGAFDGGNMGERVIKGGSFRSDPEKMFAYSRSDVYVVTSAMKMDYLGFRLAYGEIPDPVWLAHTGSFSSSLVSPMANSHTMHALAGTYFAKLVFRNDANGNLVYIDYSDVVLSAREIKDTIDSYHPDISPDGKLVAFCTGIEGVDMKSSLYVRALKNDGSAAVRLDVKSAAIPRWRVLDNGDTAIVYVTSTVNNSEDSRFFSEETWQVTFMGGKFGKPIKLFSGAYRDGIGDGNRLAISGARTLRARVLHGGRSRAVDTVWYNGEQACNASLAHDSTGKTLFLDFGSKTGQKFAHRSYGTHEMLLVADSTGRLVDGIPAPAGTSFDHSEWVNDGRSGKAVVSLVDAGGAHSRIALVDMRDSSVAELAYGDELWHPSLWVNRGMLDYVRSDASLDRDSAGVYIRDSDVSEFILRCKMELLWRDYDTANVVVVGSSRPLYGVNPVVFGDENRVVNLAQTPNSIYMSRDFLHRYVFDQFKKLEFVVLSLDFDFWWKQDDAESNFFVEDYGKLPGYVYDENHGFWKDSVPVDMYEFTREQLSSEEHDALVDYDGYYDHECVWWGGKSPAIEEDTTRFDDHPEYLRNSMAALVEIIDEAKAHGVTVVGVAFPMSPSYARTSAYGRYGMRRSTAKKLVKSMDSLAREYPNFAFMNENRMGWHDYDNSEALDYDHLCSAGAAKLSGRLDSLLVSLRAAKMAQ